MDNSIDSLFGEQSPKQKFKAPDNWRELCNFCRLMEVGKFANQNKWIVSLFPARRTKTSRLQIYVHPESVVLPYAQDTSQEFNQYWIFSIEHITLQCFCGREKAHPIEDGYYEWFSPFSVRFRYGI